MDVCHGGGWSSGTGRDLEEKKNIAKKEEWVDGWRRGASDDDLSIRQRGRRSPEGCQKERDSRMRELQKIGFQKGIEKEEETEQVERWVAAEKEEGGVLARQDQREKETKQREKLEDSPSHKFHIPLEGQDTTTTMTKAIFTIFLNGPSS